MLIRKNNFKNLESYYECKLGIESIKRSLSNLEYYTQENKEVLGQLNKAHAVLNEIEFEK